MDASLLSLILYTFPVLVTVAAVLLGRDRLTPARAPRCWPPPAARCWSCSEPAAGVCTRSGPCWPSAPRVTYTVYILVADTVVHRLPPVVLCGAGDDRRRRNLGARAPVTGGVDLDLRAGGMVLAVACIAVVSTVVAMLAFFAGPAGGPVRRPPPSCRPSNPSSPPHWPRSPSARSSTPLQPRGGR